MPNESRALVVGVSNYALAEVTDLPACIDDADLMYAALQEYCYLDSANIQLLEGRVSRETFSTELDHLLALSNDTVVVYYSEHGYLSPDGEAHLALSDGLMSTASVVERIRSACKTSWIIFDI